MMVATVCPATSPTPSPAPSLNQSKAVIDAGRFRSNPARSSRIQVTSSQMQVKSLPNAREMLRSSIKNGQNLHNHLGWPHESPPVMYGVVPPKHKRSHWAAAQAPRRCEGE